jgi:hypothetical protein
VTPSHLSKETIMSRPEVREDIVLTVDDRPTVQHSPTYDEAAPEVIDGDDAVETEDAHRSARSGDPRVLMAARFFAAGAMLVSAVIHGRLAFVQDTAGGGLLSQSHLFAAQAALSVVLAIALVTKDNRAWLVAVVLSVAGLGAILSSVYFPVPSLGPLPAINEPTWLLSKAICALTELTVIALWLIRQIAPPQD